MQLQTTASAIDGQVSRVRRLLSRCAEKFTSFDAEIVRILHLCSRDDYGSVIDCFYLFEDTELAKSYVRQHGIGTSADKSNFGLVYLTFYGLMNACYLQQQAILVCTKKLKLDTDLTHIEASRIIQFRNDFAARSPNRKGGSPEHSYILDRFGLVEDRVAGYSSNSTDGLVFRNAALTELLTEWDECFFSALSPIAEHITKLIHAEGIRET